MGTDPKNLFSSLEQGESELRNRFSFVGNSLAVAAGLSPLALAIAYNKSEIAPGTFQMPTIKSGTPLSNLGSGIGLEAKRREATEVRRANAVRDMLRKAAESGEAMDKLSKALDGYAGVVQMLSSAIEDPGFGLDQTRTQSLKSELMTALENLDTPDTKEFLQGVVRTLVDSDVDNHALLKLENYREEFRGVGASVSAPTPTVGGNRPYNPIQIDDMRSAGFGDDAIRRAQRVAGLFESNDKYSVKFMHGRDLSGPGQQGLVAQIFDRSGERFYSNVPLQVEVENETGLRFYRAGRDLNTAYAAPLGSMQAQPLAKAYRAGGPEAVRGAVKGSMFAFEDMIVDMLTTVVRGRKGFRGSHVEFNASVAQVATVVGRSAFSSDPIAKHQRRQTAIANAHYVVHGHKGIPTRELMHVTGAAATAPGMDPGKAKSALHGHGEDRVVKVGVRAGTMIENLESVYGFTRGDIPVTARVEQVTGRSEMFTQPTRGLARQVGGTFMGPVGPQFAGPHGALTSGGISEIVLMDFRNAASGMRGEGYAVTGRRRHIKKPVDMVLLDPLSHGYAESQLLKEVKAAGDAGLVVSKERFGEYFGQSPSGEVRRIEPSSSATKMRIFLDRTAQVAGKQQIHFSAVEELSSNFGKVFGLMAKANVENIGISRMKSHIGVERVGSVESVLEGLGIRLDDTIYTTNDMISKGPGMLGYQIARSTELFSTASNDIERKELARKLKGRVDNIRDGTVLQTFGFDVQEDPKGLRKNPNFKSYKFAMAAVEELTRQGALGRHIGMTLAGAYHMSAGDVTGSKGINVKGGQEKLKKRLEEFVRGSMSGTYSSLEIDDAVEAMKEGLVATTDVFQRGITVSDDYGKGRPGLEARTAMNIFSVLQSEGMSQAEAARFTSSIMGNTIAFRRKHEMASGFYNAMASAVGKEVAGGPAANYQTRTIGSVLEGVAGGSGTLLEELKKTEGGIRIVSETGTTFSSVAAEVFGGQSDIVLPGKETIAATRGVQLKEAGGQSMQVGSEYERLVTDLENIIAGSKTAGRDKLTAQLQDWKSRTTEMFSRSLIGLTRGKLRGSTTGGSGMYDLSTGKGLKKAEHEALLSLYSKTGGRFMGMNAEGFLSVLLDRKSNTSNKDLALMAQQFFTEMELEPQAFGSRPGFQGIEALGGRDPMLSEGNIFRSVIGRDIFEVKRYDNEDPFFAKLKETKAGQFLISRFEKRADTQIFGKLEGFEQIAIAPKAAQEEFFEGFIQNLHAFTTGQGGAIFKTPVMRVGIEGKKGLFDLGVSSGAFLDRDGDSVKMMFLNSEMSSQLRKMQGVDNLGFRTVVAELSQGINQGIKSLTESGRLGSMPSGKAAIMEDALKEMGLSSSTGQIDVRLRSMHTALLDYAEGMEGRQGRAMLAALQEVFVLKTKKLPRYTEAASQLGVAIDTLMTTGKSQELRSVLENMAFHGQKDATFGGGQIQIPEGLSANAHVRQLIDSANRNRQAFGLDDIMQAFERVAQQSIEAGRNYTGTTAGAWQARLQQNAAAVIQDINAARDMNSAALGSSMGSRGAAAEGINVAETVARSLSERISRFDATMTKPIALGLGASALAMSAIAGQGYSPEPLVMPGENINSRVTDSIARGNLFSSQRTVHAEQAMRTTSQAMGGGTTYTNSPNAYQIRGDTYDGASLNRLVNLGNSIVAGGGSGSIFINDSRRPITSAYSDRVMGEY